MRSFFSRFFALAFALCVFSSSSAWAAGKAQNTPEGAVRAFVTALHKGEIEKALNMQSYAEEETKEGKAALRGALSRAWGQAFGFSEPGAKKEKLDLKILSSQTNAAGDRVEMNIDFYDAKVVLVKENGVWKIAGFFGEF